MFGAFFEVILWLYTRYVLAVGLHLMKGPHARQACCVININTDV